MSIVLSGMCLDESGTCIRIGAISLGSIMCAGLLKRLATFMAACVRSVFLSNEVVAYILSIKGAG